MIEALWFIAPGALLVLMALAGSVLKRLPLSAALIYLALGYGTGKLGAVTLDAGDSAPLLERLAELAVVVSLFSSGLKLRLPLLDPGWRLPVRLASAGMVVTLLLMTIVGLAIGLPLGAAILLGAVLAPTDPVLASDVQVAHAADSDRLRFGLTGEAGLNDGAAFPFVMLGLGLLGLHDLGPYLWRWVAVDTLWSIAAGLGIGWVLGSLIGKLVLYLRRTHREAVGLDDFLALGLIGVAYGAALLLHAYGFLAVFAAGLALRATERKERAGKPPQDVGELAKMGRDDEIATREDTAPAFMASAVLGFTEQMERIGEVVLMLVVGAMLALTGFSAEGFAIAAILMLVIRPAAIALVTVGSRASGTQRALMGWFGIRGIGSLYYLFYAVNHGLPPELGERLAPLVFTVIACSAVVHGISVTPLMQRYGGGRRRERAPKADEVGT